MFTPLSIAACNLNPGDVIRYISPPLADYGVSIYPVHQAVVISVVTDNDATQVGLRYFRSGGVGYHQFPNHQQIQVTGQHSQEALDYMEDFRKFQP